uniref:Uncharacterized protein n=1 Tax=Echinococcus granulosus TaxID=6210 RepID=A0A068WI57_ECHGR|nr:hypothetical protein EgrG_001010300 [Echinococcus granulosus]
MHLFDLYALPYSCSHIAVVQTTSGAMISLYMPLACVISVVNRMCGVGVLA